MNYTISKSKFYVLIYALALLMPFLIKSFEVNVVLSVFWLFLIVFEKKILINRTLFISLLLILLMFIVGFISQLFYKNTVYDVIKDIIYFLKPLIYLFLGYFFAFKIKDKDNIFKTIIYLGIILAVLHICKSMFFLINFQYIEVSGLRNYAGKDNFLELVVCALLVVNKSNKYFKISLKYKKIIYSLLIISFLLYFSRTMFVAFFVIILVVKGYAKISKKGIVVFILSLIGIFVFYKFLNSIDLERGANGIEGFLYKVKIAPNEIFETDIDFDDPADRWDHWRAYEAQKAINQANETQYSLGLFFGKGLGALVDLGFKAPLGDEDVQFVPKIHNGYAFVLFKTGILGLLFYLLFLFNLYLQSYKLSNNEKIIFINNLISALGVYYTFTSFIITGIYNTTDVILIFLGALLFLQTYYKKKHENSCFRN